MKHHWVLVQLATVGFMLYVSAGKLHGSLCEPPDVKCDAGGECVPQNATCNSISDCPDGTDESPRHCGCFPGEFRCQNTCISEYRRCDGVCDCTDSCQDEDKCDLYQCSSTHMKCASTHICIPIGLQCNFIDDCGDGSDEICEHRDCYNLEFRCKNNECLKPGYRCNGEVNCRGGDTSDEENCSEDDYVVCDGRRIFREHFCDFYTECKLTEEDEKQNCPCDPNEGFRCSTGRCVRRSALCDNQCDCLDLCEDEIDCGKYGNEVCVSEVDYFCSQSFRCLNTEFLCDGNHDCENKDDELCKNLYQTGVGYACMSNNEICQLDNKPHCYKSYDFCTYRPQCRGSNRTHCKEEPPCDPVGQFECANGMCIRSSYRCDMFADCLDHSDEFNCDSHLCEEGLWKCASGHCIDASKRCDNVVDCANFGPYRDASDEEQCIFVDCDDTEFRCNNGRCIDNTSICFNDAALEQCRDKSHLLECVNFECPEGYYKCQESYCIPQIRVCDGYIDCVLYWDDEVNCRGHCKLDFEFHSVPNCICNDKTVDCDDTESSSVNFFELKSMNILKFSGTNLQLESTTFDNLSGVTFLDLSRNNITRIGDGYFKDMFILQSLILSENKISVLRRGVFKGLSSLRHLNLTGNMIEIIDPKAFLGLDSLTTLDLSYQNIKNLPINAFHGLRHLRSLTLRGNKLEYIVGGTFSGLQMLRFLDISANIITAIDGKAFNGLPHLETLYTDEYRFCCLSNEETDCFPKPDAFSSCDDLMSNYVLRISIWVLGSTAFLGNLLVIIWRVTHNRDNKVHSFLITNLAAGDFCMGVYLLVIAIVDLYYRGEYIIYDKQWRNSIWCQLAGFLSTFSSELSVFSLTIITLQRLTSILFPFRSKNMELGWAIKMMVVTWLLSIFLAVLPLCGIEYFGNFYGRSGVCLALHITGEKPRGWEYSVFIFLAINFVSFIIIIISYVVMFVVARRTQRAVRPQNQSDSMAMRMSVIVLTDFCCWMPIIFLGISSLLGAPISPKVYAWIAVFVLPLNAAVNPLLYTLWTSPYVRRFLKKARPSIRSLSTYYTDTRHTSVTDHHRSGNHFKLKTSQRSKKTSLKFITNSPPKNNNTATKRMDGGIASDDEQCNKLLSNQRNKDSF